MSDTTKTERLYLDVPPRRLTADGTVDGVAIIENTKLFKVGQEVILDSLTQNETRLKINRIVSDTQFIVGELKGKIDTFVDVSAFMKDESASVRVPEQKRPVIHITEIDRATYEEEPALAIRSLLVDELGNCYTEDNPLEVSDKKSKIAATVNANINFLQLMIDQGEEPTVFKTDTLVVVGDEVVSDDEGTIVRSSL